MKIIEITDGYHEPTYYLENETEIHERDEFLNFLCKPHSEKYKVYTIYCEDLEEISLTQYELVANYGTLKYPNNKENFKKLFSIYQKNYEEGEY